MMSRFRWIVLAIWVVVLGVAAGLLAPQASSVTKGGGFIVPGSDSFEAAAILEDEIGVSARNSVVVVFHSESLTVDDSQYGNDVVEATERLLAAEHVESVLTYFNTLDERFVVPDRGTTFAIVRMNATEDEISESVPDLRDHLEGLTIEHYITGLPALNYDAFIVSEDDLRRSEVFTIPIVIVLLLIVFRTIIAAAIPLLLGGASVVLAMSAIYFIGSVIDTSIFALNVASMIGLGLGIDFSLIVVSRFREERRRGLDPRTAIAVTMATAGRSITYSAITVVLSMMVLTLVLQDLMLVRSISLGVMLVAFTALLAGMTLLPAVLAILGHRIEWLRVIPGSVGRATSGEQGTWYRFSHAIMRRPLPYLTVAMIFLLVLASPVRDLGVIGASPTSIPADVESVIGAELLRAEFQDERLNPIQVVLQAPEEGQLWTPEFLTALDDVTATVGADPRVTSVDSLATYMEAVPRDGRWQNLTPEELDPAPPIAAPGEPPQIEGATIEPLVNLIFEANPLIPATAPTYIGLGEFTLEAGQNSELIATESLNVVSVVEGALQISVQQPARIIRAENLANPGAVEPVAPGEQITVNPGDQLILHPGAAGEIAASAETRFLALALFVIRPGIEPQTDWIEGQPPHDAFSGLPRRIIGGAVASQIAEGPTSINIDRVHAEPGAYFQHHLHPGPELFLIEAGTMTIYASPEMTMTGSDGSIVEGPFDTPLELGPGGRALVQSQGIHRARNLGNEPATFYSVRVLDATEPAIVVTGVQENVAQLVNLEGDNDTAVINIVAQDGMYTEGHQNLVFDLRDDIIENIPSTEGFDYYVGGDAASFADLRDTLYGRFPIIVLVVALINFIILMMFFQSVVLPIKAIILNLIGILATLGVLVAIFQWGWFTGLLRFESQGLISVVTPAVLYVILFALSTDYEVFMLSRVKEVYSEIGDNEEAVAIGLQQTAGVITAAGLILIGTFGSFATAQVLTIKEIGLGLAIAVLIDATIIRIVLVPATMRLMGDWNWWMPEALKRIVPEIKEAPSFEPVPQPVGVPVAAASAAADVSRPVSAPGSTPVPAVPAPVSQLAAARPNYAQLRPTTDVLGVEIIPLSYTRPFTIGRDPLNVLQLFDMRISRFHARIERDVNEGRFFIIDLNSSNGVFVNGERIVPQPARTAVRQGDLIEIGNMGLVTLVFEEFNGLESQHPVSRSAERPSND